MRNLIIGQSGGPTSVINASLAGCYKEAKKQGYDKVYGMVNGIEGLLKERIIDLDDYLSTKENYELLKRTPSSFLQTCRYKMGTIKDNKETYEKVFKILDKHSIDSLIYIGGNDSMDTVQSLSDYAEEYNKKQNFVGVPKTIDNDLAITDHCPGYGSAAKYIATTLREIIRDNTAYGITNPTVCIVEIMGRHAGWLTAAAALAKDETCEGVDAIYLPEVPIDVDDFIETVKKKVKEKSSVVIAVSEGLKTLTGEFVCELENDNIQEDMFGHKQLGGCATTLAHFVQGKTNLKVRPIVLSTIQRCASHVVSARDLKEAEMCGKKGARLAYKNYSGKMVIMKRVSDDPYKISYKMFNNIHEIANVEKKIPLDWIDVDNHQVHHQVIDYIKPLIQGEVKQIYKDGLPQHLYRK